MLRIMTKERKDDYVERSGRIGQRHWFHTDAECRLVFKVPVFEGVDDSVAFHFRGGGEDSDEFGGSLHWTGSWFRRPLDEEFKPFTGWCLI